MTYLSLSAHQGNSTRSLKYCRMAHSSLILLGKPFDIVFSKPVLVWSVTPVYSSDNLQHVLQRVFHYAEFERGLSYPTLCNGIVGFVINYTCRDGAVG